MGTQEDKKKDLLTTYVDISPDSSVRSEKFDNFGYQKQILGFGDRFESQNIAHNDQEAIEVEEEENFFDDDLRIKIRHLNFSSSAQR